MAQIHVINQSEFVHEQIKHKQPERVTYLVALANDDRTVHLSPDSSEVCRLAAKEDVIFVTGYAH